MTNDIKRLVGRLVQVNKAIAKSSQSVQYGTVTGKNPDGTVNVDLGNGGCVIVTPQANVARGDRIPVGTQTPLGTTTNLDPFYIFLNGPTQGCPTDPRPIPVLPVAAPVLAGINDIGSSGMTSWGERDTDLGDGSVEDCSTWEGLRKSAVVTSGFSEVLAQYNQETVGSCPVVQLFAFTRNWIAFDLTAVKVAGALTGRLTFTINYLVSTLGNPYSPHNTDVVILPSTATLPVTIADIANFDRSKKLGRFRMLQDKPSSGSGTYTTEVDLDLSSYLGVFPTTLVFCLMSGFDMDSIEPPLLAPLDDGGFNTLYTDSFIFDDATLEFDIPLL